jgi:hypothetical protein
VPDAGLLAGVRALNRIPTRRPLVHRLLSGLVAIIEKHPVLTGLLAAVLVSSLNSF